MKKRDYLSLLYLLASPVLLIVLGLILIISPDTASALIARVLGWVVILVGIGIGVAAIFDRNGAVFKGLAAVGCVTVGGFLMRNPLILAAGIGRVLGILLILRGGRDFFLSRRGGHGQLLAIITTIVGVVLAVLPMTTSRLVFSACGVVVLLIGGAMLLQRLRERKYLDDGGDSNIIDAL